ncbi:MAG: hypothetical protein M3220_14960 [Chloroflexota bacterium]|nr:hypothetical protein [Chloroflexota bacterium]
MEKTTDLEQRTLDLEMETAIQIVWWLGLAGALIGTLAILRVVELVIRALSDIHQLAKLTREAARGVADNMEGASRVSNLEKRSQGLHDSVAALATAIVGLQQKLDDLSSDRLQEGG